MKKKKERRWQYQTFSATCFWTPACSKVHSRVSCELPGSFILFAGLVLGGLLGIILLVATGKFPWPSLNRERYTAFSDMICISQSVLSQCVDFHNKFYGIQMNRLSCWLIKHDFWPKAIKIPVQLFSPLFSPESSPWSSPESRVHSPESSSLQSFGKSQC